MARHPMGTFLGMVYAIAWTATAFLVTAATQGEAGVRDLLDRSLRWRVEVRWYLIALFGFLVIVLLVTSVFQGPASLWTLTEKWPIHFTLFLPEVLFPFLFIQLFEEAGWTGFMQHILQERRSPLLASALVVPAFALMHLPVFLIDSGVGLGLLIVFGALVIMMTFFRIVVTWLYNSSGRSVLVVALFHSAFNSATSLGNQQFTGELISGSTLPYAVGMLVVLALAIAVFSRGRLAYGPERAATQPAEARGVAVQPRVQWPISGSRRVSTRARRDSVL